MIDNYSRYDPAEVAQFYNQLHDLLVLFEVGLRPEADLRKQEENKTLESRQAHETTGGTGTGEAGVFVSSRPPEFVMNRSNMPLILC